MITELKEPVGQIVCTDYYVMLRCVIITELKEPVGQIVCTDKGVMAVEQNKVLVPPSWSKTFAWGYADLSCRLCNYESDKVSTTVSHDTHEG